MGRSHTLVLYLNEILYTINLQRKDNLYELRSEFGEVSEISAMRQIFLFVITYV